MDSLNTPLHKHLWHRDFIALIISELLITASVYMQIPLFLQRYIDTTWLVHKELGIAVGLFGIGLFAIGPFTNWLIQHYRRNKVYVFSTIGMLLILLFISMLDYESRITDSTFNALFYISCFMFGCFYSLSKRTLTGVLMIDKCESYNRTEANVVASWISRISLSVGPAVAVVAMTTTNNVDTDIIANSCLILAIILVCLVRFPFKTPDDNVSVVSADRFFYSHGIKYFLILAAVYAIIGMIISLEHTVLFYAMLFGGFIVVMITSHFFIRNSKKISVVLGLIFMLAAFLFIVYREYPYADYIVPLFLGCSTGYIGSYMLHKYIDSSIHCKRSTAISSYFLACEGGLACGICLSYIFFDNQYISPLYDLFKCF